MSRKSLRKLQDACLPQEVVSHVFRFLQPVDIRSASLVCHSWAKAAEDPLLWRHIAFIIFTKSELFSDFLLDSLERRRVQHISMRHTATAAQIIQVCKQLGENIQTLSLRGCRCVNEKVIEVALKSCKNLTKIDLGRCRQLDCGKKSCWIENCSSNLKIISALDISCCKGLCDWTLFQLSLYQAKLVTLCISGCKEVSLQTWSNLATNLTSLKNLDISRSDISDEVLLHFCEIPSLHLLSINLSACKQLSDNGIVSLVKNQTCLQYLKLSCLDITNTSVLAIGKYLHHLKCLDLNSCRQITDNALLSSRELMKNLESINLYSCYQLTSKGLQMFFSKVKEESSGSSFPLKALILNGCSLVTDVMLDKCCHVLSNVQELDLSSCLHITDGGLESITTFLTELKVLKLSWCANVTDAGLLGISYYDTNNKNSCHSNIQKKGCQGNQCLNGRSHRNSSNENDDKAVHGIRKLRKLSWLDVSHCTNISDEGMTSVFNLENLRTLNLNMCLEITDVSLLGIAEHAKMLQSLSLNGCSRITDTGLVAIAKGLSNHLCSLDISKCDDITDLAILTLAKYNKNLTHLDLSMCSQITSNGIDELEANVPGLVSLQLMYSGANSMNKYF